jgi:hypothetical protein
MKQRIVSFVLIFATLFSVVSVTISAAREEEFISEVALVYEDSVEEARDAIAGTDWKLWEQDLNPDADYIIDDGVYLIYKTSTNVEDAITDLRVMDMYGGYSTTNYQRQLEKSREHYMQMIAKLRVATAEFKALYEAGDEMAKLAYRQMNYYKDVKTEGGTETDMMMGDFFLNLPTDDKIVQVFMEGNSIIISNLVSLIAVGISGAGGETLSTRIAEKYAIKDTLTDEKYYDDAKALVTSFAEIKAKLLRYDALSEEYDITDENEEMTEEAYQFLTQNATVADLLTTIQYGDKTLADFLRGEWETKDLYPIIAAFTEGQMALVEMGQLETVLKYNSPSKPIADLTATLEKLEESLTDENGDLKVFDVYTGVDREIFKGDFAMTTASERQQALMGETWDLGSAASRSQGMTIGYIVAGVVDLAFAAASIGIAVKGALLNSAEAAALAAMKGLTGEAYFAAGETLITAKETATNFALKWGGLKAPFATVAVAFALILAGGYSIATWYNYYNPDYLTIPNTLIDVCETEIGDKYVKYTAAKVFGDEEGRNADFNAYEGKEWNALYYTKDATAGSCLTPKFVYSETSSTIARRHQGISMFGETEAFNLNSHVYSKNAPGVYVTIRYSTAEKAAADMPSVVGSMIATGAFYALTALGGAGLGVGGTILVQRARKKKDDPTPENAKEIE